MKTLPAGMQDHLDSGATTLCWCWQLTRRDGVVMGFTDHDEAVQFGGVTHDAMTGFTSSEIKSSLGLSVDNVDVEGALSSDSITERDISAGLYDDAAVTAWRVNWRDTSQRIIMRAGNLGEISRGEKAFRAEIRGLAHKLQQPQGRVYQRTCDATLGDERCGVDTDNANFRGSGTVSAIDGGSTVRLSGLSSFDEGWFDRGVMRFDSGANSGLELPIRSHINAAGLAQIGTWVPIPSPVAINDDVTLIAGCDKRIETCRAKFSNVANFRGFPHMPGNDFVTGYPNTGDANLDGDARYDSY